MNMLSRDLGAGDLCDNIGLSGAMSLHHLTIMTKPSLYSPF